MNLIIDIGNTFTKLGVFDSNACLKAVFSVKSEVRTIFSELNKILTEHPNTKFNCIIGSVAEYTDEIKDFLETKKISCLIFSSKTPIPLINKYETPDTLGMDRLAGILGSIEISPCTHNLVIDAGTALTIDYVSPEKEYSGGIISPGLAMRFRALNVFTRKLPEISSNPGFEQLTGASTEAAIRAGVQNGIVFEISEYINRFSTCFPEIKVFLTGGDTNFFVNKLKNDIFVDSHLVLKGLNHILNYNAKNFNY